MNVVRALAICIGILGVVAIYRFTGLASTFGLQIWAAFLGWASFFASGETKQALLKSLAANFWGAVWATAALVLLARFGSAGVPVVALIICGTCGAMMLGTRLVSPGATLAQVFGYAATASFGLLTGSAGLDFSLGSGPFTTVALSMIAGAGFGYATRLSLSASSAPDRLLDRKSPPRAAALGDAEPRSCRSPVAPIVKPARMMASVHSTSEMQLDAFLPFGGQ
jgi:Protein of unknown function (DUF1097)